jgi:hypothetical protein
MEDFWLPTSNSRRPRNTRKNCIETLKTGLMSLRVKMTAWKMSWMKPESTL